MGGTISPIPFPPFLTNAGVPANGYKLFTYTAGTSTKLATYTDADLTAAHTNPILVNSAGRTPSPIYLSPGISYKFVFALDTDTDPPASPLWTADPVNAVEPSTVDVDITARAGEQISAGYVVYLSSGSGGKTAGRWYFAEGANNYSSSTASAIGILVSPTTLDAGDFGTVRIVGRADYHEQTLTAGTVYYIESGLNGKLTSTAPANARPVGIADGSDTIVLSQWVQGTEDISGAKQFLNAVTCDSSIKSSSATAGIGYATGAGGTVTQQTDKATGVELNKACGQITMNAAALAAAAEVSFTVTCSAVAATDVVIVNHGSAGTAGAYLVGVSTVGAGSFVITVANVSAGSLSEAIVINYAVIKGVAA